MHVYTDFGPDRLQFAGLIPQDAWAKVREVIGKARRGDSDVDGITAQVLNDYFAAISTDRSYQEPALKSTALDRICCITEIEVLYTRSPTAYSHWTGWCASLVFAARRPSICDTASPAVQSVSSSWYSATTVEGRHDHASP